MTATLDRVGLGVVGAGAFAQFLVEWVADLPRTVNLSWPADRELPAYYPIGVSR